MSRKLAKILSALLLAVAVAVTQIPVSDVEAVASTSDFQMDGSKLLRYSGTAEVVSIPDGVKEIGEEAFAGNDHLIKVTIGGDVERIGYRAFADCDNLRTIQVDAQIEEIETAAFSNNKQLRNVSLGAGVKDLGSGVFAGCSNLSTLTVSADNPYLYYSSGVLYDDEQKIIYALLPNYEKEAFTLPETVEEIRAYAFWGNPYLVSVRLDSALKNVPAYAFSNCLNLKEVTIPLPVHTIEAKAFEDCVNLKTVTLPESISNIHATAFDGCSRVEIVATPGTYGADFAASLRSSEADAVEYEDVRDSETVTGEEIIGQATPTPAPVQEEATPSPEATAVPTPPPAPNVIGGSSGSGRVLGESSIVSGRAVIFIDNVQNSSVGSGGIDIAQPMENSGVSGELMNIVSDNAQKGKDFPKYTVVGGKIASQAYYQDASLTEYEIESGITQIGEFAFARTPLKSIVIPDGVEKIGYGAFYHCDSLREVSIPDSVQEISASAFGMTPWLTQTRTEDYPYLIVGDGILIYYAGTDSVVNIPEGVKQISAEVFKDHMGITAVNIPASVEVIGDAAFSGCRNLKTVNGASGVRKIGDRAFQDCPLSQIVIPAGVEEIGLAAYDCQGGTDTVVFQGIELPILVVGEQAKRLSNSGIRTYVFGDCRTAVVPAGAVLDGTVLQSGSYGFHGMVYDESQNLLADLSGGVTQVSNQGIALEIDSYAISGNGENAMATMPGNDSSFVLKITDSTEAARGIAAGYSELYGGREPSGLQGFDISLYDSAGQIPITKLGRQYVTVLIPKPSGAGADGLHVVSLDEDGQLVAVEHQVLELEDGEYIQFTTNHFSPYGIYQYSSWGGQGVVTGGSAYVSMSGNKDDTPDTGDGLHPKWFLAMGLLAASVALFFYKGKRVVR